MVYCSSCGRNVPGERPNDGPLSCNFCGKVLEEYNFSSEAQFVKDSSGQSKLSGHFVKSVQDIAASRERTLANAREGMSSMKIALGMDEYSDDVVNTATRFYEIALERNFTRGRSSDLVQAACLYLACRQKKKPYLLIDFSEHLSRNVYEIGAVYLQLCYVLYLADTKDLPKLIDPSIFIPKFTHTLIPEGNNEVVKTARNILASMKRDWMQTGRKPSGLCGAALYISALSHGLKYSKSDIIRVVHICEATLTKRLIEFENTDSGSLTIEELTEKEKELRTNSLYGKQPNIGSKGAKTDEVLCKHVNKNPFAYGLCEECYEEFIDVSGGLDGGTDPPAFQRAEKERLKKFAMEENANGESGSPLPSGPEKPESVGVPEDATKHSAMDEGDKDKLPGDDGSGDESDNFSDIDDLEVDGYLHNEEEKHFKKIIWEEMNREYLEEQAAKEAAAAAAKEAFMAKDGNPEDLQAAELAAAVKAAVEKSRKEKQQKRAAEEKNSGPPQTAAEATRRMLVKRRLSSKINYDALEKLFDESAVAEKPKKQKNEPHSDEKEENVSKVGAEEDELGEEYNYDEEGGDGGTYDNNLVYEDEGYDYDDDYGYDGF